jgi:hypothetical protein
MTEETTGAFWCDICHQMIPDQYTDHMDRHETAPPQARLVTTTAATFWALCIAFGVIAGVLVARLM